MIKPERLKELYKNGAIVYGVYREYDDYGHYDNIIEEQDLAEGYYIDVYEKYGITGILDDLKNTYGNLFETKSEAEFYAKYGNVEKTIKMPVPPIWKEFKKEGIFYIDKDVCSLIEKYDKDGNLCCCVVWQNSYIKNFEYSKKGYSQALDKMVELWREE